MPSEQSQTYISLVAKSKGMETEIIEGLPLVETGRSIDTPALEYVDKQISPIAHKTAVDALVSLSLLSSLAAVDRPSLQQPQDQAITSGYDTSSLQVRYNEQDTPLEVREKIAAYAMSKHQQDLQQQQQQQPKPPVVVSQFSIDEGKAANVAPSSLVEKRRSMSPTTSYSSKKARLTPPPARGECAISADDDTDGSTVSPTPKGNKAAVKKYRDKLKQAFNENPQLHGQIKELQTKLAGHVQQIEHLKRMLADKDAHIRELEARLADQ